MNNQTHVDDFKAFVAEFAKESERALVVLTAARLDFLLFRILQKYLVPDTAKVDDFFENQGPGATFSSKIMLSYRLGLIDRQFVSSLNLLRRIRNDFAHEPTDCSLAKGKYRDQVRSLCAPFKKSEFFDFFREECFSGESDVRIEFMTAVGIMLTRLEFLFDALAPVDPAISWPLFNKSMLTFKKATDEPNQALEPTPTAVTPPAAQEPRQP
jgi:hypothetical protein